jgi:hypothetical protein
MLFRSALPSRRTQFSGSKRSDRKATDFWTVFGKIPDGIQNSFALKFALQKNLAIKYRNRNIRSGILLKTCRAFCKTCTRTNRILEQV